MASPKIVVVDYGASNLRSVAKAFEKVGCKVDISGQAKTFDSADALVLPGQGAAKQAMNGLKERGLIEPILRFINDGGPFFGVCMGLQLLFEWSEEGEQLCLELLKGKVRRLPSSVKTPHMGWNQVCQRAISPLYEGIPDQSYFYFVHSYYPVPEDSALVIGEVEYDMRFCCAVAKDNLVATLFHPEKSGEVGLKMYENFLRYWIKGEEWK